nr:ISAzo13 family transposase [bacterium]
MATPAALRRKFAQVWPHLDERARRLVAASEALQHGYGGIMQVSRACGLSRLTIAKGIRELAAAPLPPGRIRRPGAGRRRLTVQDPALPQQLEALVEPLARGDPASPLRWTCKSTRTLAATLAAQAHPVSHTKVAQLLRDLGYSLQGNRKTEEGAEHPERDAQFAHINAAVQRALLEGAPVLSVDTKKKEL